MKKREYIIIKICELFHSSYFLCILLIIVCCLLILLLPRKFSLNDTESSVLIGFSTGVASTCIMTIIFNLRADQLERKRKQSCLQTLFFYLRSFNEAVTKDKPEKKCDEEKIAWTYCRLSPLISELEKVLSYHSDYLNDEEYSTIRDILVRYSLMSNLFSPYKEALKYDFAFEEKVAALIKNHPKDINVIINNMGMIVLRIEVLEYLFYYDRMYKDLNRNSTKTIIFGIHEDK